MLKRQVFGRSAFGLIGYRRGSGIPGGHAFKQVNSITGPRDRDMHDFVFPFSVLSRRSDGDEAVTLRTIDRDAQVRIPDLAGDLITPVDEH